MYAKPHTNLLWSLVGCLVASRINAELVNGLMYVSIILALYVRGELEWFRNIRINLDTLS